MNIIDDTLGSLTIGGPSAFENLTVFPLIARSDRVPAHDTLDAALLRGTLQVTEVSDSGRVPEIRVLNGRERPVLIIDGDELVGAKQNRTVNLSILVPAHADQSQVWDAIALKSARLRAPSATGAMADIYSAHAGRVEDFVRAIPVAAGQAGSIFVVNGEPIGVDLFDSAETLRAMLPKILRGYALDAIDRRRAATPLDASAVSGFLQSVVTSERQACAAVGVGECWRFTGGDISGGVLTTEDRLIHLSAFRTPQAGELPHVE